MAKQTFPDKVFVVIEKPEGDEPFVLSFDSLEDAVDQAGDGGEVAVYAREVVRVADIKRSLR
jgi:hypothetical protein